MGWLWLGGGLETASAMLSAHTAVTENVCSDRCVADMQVPARESA